jgi:hypothetical protein
MGEPREWTATERANRLRDMLDPDTSSSSSGVTAQQIVQDYTISEARETLQAASQLIMSHRRSIENLSEAKRLIKRELLGEDEPKREREGF